MDQFETRGDKTRMFAGMIALVLVASMVSGPIASAATNVVAKIKGSKGQAIKASKGAVHTRVVNPTTSVNAKMRDSSNGAVESSPVTFDNSPIPPTGANSDGAIDVKTYSGGGSFLGAGDCTTAVGGPDIVAVAPPGQGLPNFVTVPGGTIITALLVNGTDGQVKVTSANPGLSGLPALQRYRVTAEMPNVVAAFGNGLAINDALTFTGVKSTDNGPGGDDVDGECNFVVLGQDL